MSSSTTLRVWAEDGELVATEQVAVNLMGTYMLPTKLAELPAGHYTLQLDELPSINLEVRRGGVDCE